jgi:hypothetical protein
MIINLFIDTETTGILIASERLPVLHALSHGMINTSVMTVDSRAFPKDELLFLREQQFRSVKPPFLKLVRQIKTQFSPSSFVTFEKDNSLSHPMYSTKKFVPQNLARWAERQRLCIVRARYLTEIETYCQRLVYESSAFFDVAGLDLSLREALDKSDPSVDVFHPHILSWASLRNTTPREAYSHLRLLIDGYRLNCMRSHALWEKYIEIINDITTDDRFSEIISEFERDVLTNGQSSYE